MKFLKLVSSIYKLDYIAFKHVGIKPFYCPT